MRVKVFTFEEEERESKKKGTHTLYARQTESLLAELDFESV